MPEINFLSQTIKELGTLKLIVIATAFVAIILGMTVIFSKGNDNDMIPLFMDLDFKDASLIMKELETQNIPHNIKSEGSVILVPKDLVLKLRMDFAERGLPNSGSVIGYEVFDKSETLGTSNFVQNVNLTRALEGELARTISSFQNIQKARVHLVIPKKELFSKEVTRPSASVALTMKGSNVLSKEQVHAITHLVSTAVKNLEPSSITIVDTQGRSLKLGVVDVNDLSYITSTAQDYKISYENHLRNVIENLLEQTLGANKAKARVSADINFDRLVTNSETYDPESKVTRSVQTTDEKESSTDKSSSSEVSVATNLPDYNQNNAGGNNSSNNSQKTAETTNYEISKTVKNHISGDTGKITKLSIAVVVDGIYIHDVVNKKTDYKPRTSEELEQIKAIIKSAVGFDEKRNDVIEVANMQFIQDLSSLSEDELTVWLREELPSLIQTLVIATVVVLILLLVVRPIALQAFEMSKKDFDEIDNLLDQPPEVTKTQDDGEPVLAGIAGSGSESTINISHVEEKLRSGSVKVLNDLAKKFPEETLNALRNWLNVDKEKEV